MTFRRHRGGALLGGALLLGFALGCVGGAPAPAPLAEVDPPGTVFQSERAWADLEALASAGPRPPGSSGADAARAYLVGALGGVGLEAEERTTLLEVGDGETLELTHVSVVIPGASPDRFVLLGTYDSNRLEGADDLGVNLGASGSALMLELARALVAQPPAYTVQLLFVEGDGRLGVGEGDTRDRRGAGSALLAAQMKEQGELVDVRLLVAFKGVCDADLGIARDLLSHRHYREEFWRVARDLGYSEVFPRDAHFESVEAGHAAFGAEGVRSVVAVADTAYGGSESPGIYAADGRDVIDHCSARSMRVVGNVTLAAITRIGERLDRIDRFARRPLAEPVPEVDVVEPEVQPAASEEGASE